jgi:hypothetical protein
MNTQLQQIHLPQMVTGLSYNYGVVVEQEEGLSETTPGVVVVEQANMFMGR